MQRRRDPFLRGRSATMPGAADVQPATPPRRIDSQTLLGAAQEVEIIHLGQVYRLRRTALGKLILTK